MFFHNFALFNRLTLVTALLFCGIAPAEVEVRLISGATGTQSPSPLPLGLEITLAPHWKTYWRTAGTAGYAASINWEGSQNLKSAQILWPAPTRFAFAGLESYGYSYFIILPIDATPQDPSQPMSLKAEVNMMACAEQCIPFTFNFALDIPAGPALASPLAPLIESARAKVPSLQTESSTIKITKATPTPEGDLLIHTHSPQGLMAPDIFVESENGSLFAAPVLEDKAAGIYRAKLLTPDNKLPTSTQITLTLVDGVQAITHTLPVTSSTSALIATAATHQASTPYLTMLAIAFVGGLILNLMPCVLPVLSLKILSVMNHAGAKPQHMRKAMLASALGIITSFLILAGLAIALKSAGAMVGWGVQFQQPYFLIGMMLLLTLFAASLWGLLNIPLPRFLADAVTDRLPQSGESDHTILGNFITGMFATLLATPCSAPFVGTAIGFALAGSSLTLLLIALCMGLGMSAPFLLLAARPQLGRFIPKPGRWMLALKAVLGIALLGTAFWLGQILSHIWPLKEAATASGAIFVLLAILWIRASIQRPVLIIYGLGMIVLMAVALQLLDSLSAQAPTSSTEQTTTLPWTDFDEQAIPALVADGKTVLVDVTADWCLTCAANEKLVLNSSDGRALLMQPDMVLMRADWTAPNPAIADYLKRHGRYGIPFNILYGPSQRDGLVLSEILTIDALQEGIKSVK
jgi:suppressor for copper-sensitivity B